MIFSLVVAAVAAVATPSAATGAAQSHAGVWELDLSRSDTASDHPRADYAVTRVIRAQGGTITEAETTRNLDIFGSRMPIVTSSYTLSVDGLERAVAGLNRMPVLPAETQATASWQGENLVIQAHGSDALGFWRIIKRSFVSQNGEDLTEFVTTSSTLGDAEQRLVFRRKH